MGSPTWWHSRRAPPPSPWAARRSTARLGPVRIEGAYAWQTFLKLGVHLAFGSDFPVENPNPIWGFYAAVSRQDRQGNPDGGWFPNQRLTRAEALRSWTIEGAYAAFQETTKGSIEPGKFADFVVLSDDIMRIAPARTFAFACGIPVFGVCSLDVLAHQAWLEDAAELGQSCVVATDARRKEVYWARYDITVGGVERRGEPAVAKAETIANEVRRLPVIGRGGVLYADWFGRRVGPLDVSAGALAGLAARRLAAGEELVAAEPMYLRRPDARPLPPRQPVLS